VSTTLRIKKILVDDFGDEFTCVLYFSNDDISEIQSKAAKLTMKEIGKS